MLGERIAVGLVVVVTVVWIVGYGLAYYRDTPLPSELSGLMAIVLGSVLGGGIASAVRRRNGNGKGKDETRD